MELAAVGATYTNIESVNLAILVLDQDWYVLYRNGYRAPNMEPEVLNPTLG